MIPSVQTTMLASAMVLAIVAAPASGDVTLKSADGSIQMSGELLAFDGSQYVLLTNIGQVVIEANGISCSGSDCPAVDGPLLTFAASETLADTLLPALLDGYSFALDAEALITSHPGSGTQVVLDHLEGQRLAEIHLNRAETSTAFEALASGQANLAFVSREISSAEAQLVAATGQGDLSSEDLSTIVALDGIVIVTHRDNAIQSLTEAEIAGIFAGRITNWLELGGQDAEIALYTRHPASGTGQAFANMIMAPNNLNIAPVAKLMQSDASIADVVASDESGIGFTTFSNLRNAHAVALRGACGIQTAANAFTIKTEEYPYTNRIYSYLPPKSHPAILTGFQTYLQSDDAQDTIRLAGFVDQAISVIPVNDQGLRFATAVLASESADDGLAELQSMVSQLLAAARLSVTFRFRKGSSEPDDRAQSDLVRLAQQISDGRFAGKELLFVGFSDSYGDAAGNKALSLRRAEAVRDTLLAQLPEDVAANTVIEAQGYGELSPLGCDTNEAGRQINRRVEVWLRDPSLETGLIFKAD